MGVDITVLTQGDGISFPKNGDTVTVHYTGRLLDGSKFDSSLDRGKPFKFILGSGHVIKGWDEGVSRMTLGEKSVLTISPDFAYGELGHLPVIPARSTLKFEIELLGINR
ncbi:peptidylprolyl isomerase [Pseudomonas sp. DTU12.3]|uniref:FKBP-type peptidyl-prolyl cis-trans isomerase n=1 Tax=Pseudomonas sp. DTU12.3 TaxID=2073078 RepID=UPI001011E9CB|nr:FKBP-type peptidyl-prolyl cis-trans isomerase [Pseudomonas sp. DTU12.3]QAX84458.1 peptidylprolyl isomerase [Pseudomonas sp. DTU12.3]